MPYFALDENDKVSLRRTCACLHCLSGDYENCQTVAKVTEFLVMNEKLTRIRIADEARAFALETPYFSNGDGDRMVDCSVSHLASDLFHYIMQTPPSSRKRIERNV